MAMPPPPSRVRHAVDSILGDCVGYSFPPVRHAIQAADWTPDSPSDYCTVCGDSIGHGEATPSGCATCRKGGEQAGGLADGVVRLGPHAQALRQWILALKYSGWAEIGEWLGGRLAGAVRVSNLVDPQRTILVPIPMPWMRRFFRGIDHTSVIATGAANELKAPVISLLKKKNGPPQVSLTMSERKRQGSRGLRVKRRWGGWPLHDAHVLLIDDVRTTGTTLRAATRLLRTLKPEKIVCAVLAVSDSNARRQRAEQAREHAAAVNPNLEITHAAAT